MVHVHVKCAICGRASVMLIWHHWYRTNASLPEVWICDDHRAGFYELKADV
jgi:hypothetical protein